MNDKELIIKKLENDVDHLKENLGELLVTLRTITIVHATKADYQLISRTLYTMHDKLRDTLFDCVYTTNRIGEYVKPFKCKYLRHWCSISDLFKNLSKAIHRLK